MVGIDPRRYLLSLERSVEIFRERIVPDLLEGFQAQDRPTVVFVAGQPGAGKTMTTKSVVDQLAARGGATIVNSDYYKPYHPEYHRLLQEDDRTAAPYTSLDGRRWMALAQRWAVERRINMVVETTMRDDGDFVDPARMLRGEGFRAEAAVLAVPAALSRLGILARYSEQVAASGRGRLTEVANHDASYDGVVAACRVIDEERLVDAVAVYRRGNLLVYGNHLDGSGGVGVPGWCSGSGGGGEGAGVVAGRGAGVPGRLPAGGGRIGSVAAAAAAGGGWACPGEHAPWGRRP